MEQFFTSIIYRLVAEVKAASARKIIYCSLGLAPSQCLKTLANSDGHSYFMPSKNYNYWKKKRFGAPDVPYNKLYEPIIVDRRIIMGAKVLFADLVNLCNNRGKCCIASNGYFAKRYGVGTDAIKAWIKQLKDAGYITSTGRRERKIYINMQAVRDSYAYGVKITPEEATPIGVKTTLYEKTGEKGAEIPSSNEEEKNND